jgi:hypothetical protein
VVLVKGRTENPLESLFSCVVFSSADWGAEQDRAWMYGVVAGWDPCPGDTDEEDAMSEVAARFEQLKQY